MGRVGTVERGEGRRWEGEEGGRGGEWWEGEEGWGGRRFTRCVQQTTTVIVAAGKPMERATSCGCQSVRSTAMSAIRLPDSECVAAVGPNEQKKTAVEKYEQAAAWAFCPTPPSPPSFVSAAGDPPHRSQRTASHSQPNPTTPPPHGSRSSSRTHGGVHYDLHTPAQLSSGLAS